MRIILQEIGLGTSQVSHEGKEAGKVIFISLLLKVWPPTAPAKAPVPVDGRHIVFVRDIDNKRPLIWLLC